MGGRNEEGCGVNRANEKTGIAHKCTVRKRIALVKVPCTTSSECCTTSLSCPGWCSRARHCKAIGEGTRLVGRIEFTKNTEKWTC